MKHVILLNGAPLSGKGTFANMFGDDAEVGSIINGIKNVARLMFDWDQVKDARGRKLLYDLFIASMEYDKGPLRGALSLAIASNSKITIIDIRDPDTIGALKRILDVVGVKCTTVLIRRDDAEVDALKAGLPADCRTSEYEYDAVLFNNGTLEDFKSVVAWRFGDMLPE